MGSGLGSESWPGSKWGVLAWVCHTCCVRLRLGLGSGSGLGSRLGLFGGFRPSILGSGSELGSGLEAQHLLQQGSLAAEWLMNFQRAQPSGCRHVRPLPLISCMHPSDICILRAFSLSHAPSLHPCTLLDLCMHACMHAMHAWVLPLSSKASRLLCIPHHVFLLWPLPCTHTKSQKF